MNALYFPSVEDDQILRLSEAKPCRAHITAKDGDRADLIVVDHYGQAHVRLQVAIGNQRHEPDHCELVA